MNMKKLYYILIAGSLALLSSCQEPEFVEPDAVRQGITSLTAYAAWVLLGRLL